jgi:hypothetical protein
MQTEQDEELDVAKQIALEKKAIAFAAADDIVEYLFENLSILMDE